MAISYQDLSCGNWKAQNYTTKCRFIFCDSSVWLQSSALSIYILIKADRTNLTCFFVLFFVVVLFFLFFWGFLVCFFFVFFVLFFFWGGGGGGLNPNVPLLSILTF